MPVEFLSDDEAAAYGRYTPVPSQAELDKVFFLDDEGPEAGRPAFTAGGTFLTCS
jgi:hypothetical protein